MNNFEFYSPTKIFFGKDTERSVGKIIASYGYKKVLVHFGGGSAERSGLIDRVRLSLEENNVEYFLMGGVKPNPRLSLVETGIQFCKDNSVDFILAVGGGSVIDSSKAIALGLVDDGELWDFFSRKRTPKGAWPVGVILTIAAAGSEMSNSCVISNDYTGEKRGCRSDYNRPLFAIMNPELTYTLPDYQLSCGIVDMIMHTIERYFSLGRGNDLSDRIAAETIKCVIENGLKSLINPTNYDYRSELMWAGSISHNNLTGLGSQNNFVCHAIEHELSAMFDVAHGAGLAVVFPAWARYIYKKDVNRFADLARLVWSIFDEDKEKAALEGIRAFENLFRKINMPLTLTELGLQVLDDDQIEALADGCTSNGAAVINAFVPLSKADVINIIVSINR